MNEHNDYEHYVSTEPYTALRRASDLPWLIQIFGIPLMSVAGLYALTLIF